MYLETCPPPLVLWILPLYHCLAPPPHQLHQRALLIVSTQMGTAAHPFPFHTATAEVLCEHLHKHLIQQMRTK